MVMIPLGPGLRPEMAARILDPQQMDVLSFGTDYEVQLPAHAGGWFNRSSAGGHALLRPSARGPSDQRLFLRANFSPGL